MLIEKTTSIKQEGILQGTDLMLSYKVKGQFFHKMSYTYKLSSSRFMSSRTNEWMLSEEQDPKQFRSEI